MTPADPLAGVSPMSGLSGIAYGAGMLVLVCIGAIFVLRFLYGGGRPLKLGFGQRLIRLVDRTQLGTNRFLLIIEVTGKMYLLGVTEQSINLLTPLDADTLSKDPAWRDPSEMNAAPFAAYLSSLSRRWKKNKEGSDE